VKIMKDLYLDASIWTSSRGENPLLDFMIVASPAESRPVILKEALRHSRERLINDSFELIEPNGVMSLSLQDPWEGFGLRFETMSGESFGLAFYRCYDKGRVFADVILNLKEESFDKLVLSAFKNMESPFWGEGDTRWEHLRDRISFTLPRTELIKVSIKRLPTFKKEQEAYYKVEIFEMPTKSHLQRDFWNSSGLSMGRRASGGSGI
jgi:hypothetical protein